MNVDEDFDCNQNGYEIIEGVKDVVDGQKQKGWFDEVCIDNVDDIVYFLENDDNY